MALRKPKGSAKMKRSANPEKVTSKGKGNPKGGKFGKRRKSGK